MSKRKWVRPPLITLTGLGTIFLALLAIIILVCIRLVDHFKIQNEKN
jgi:hypothetical protein